MKKVLFLFLVPCGFSWGAKAPDAEKLIKLPSKEVVGQRLHAINLDSSITLKMYSTLCKKYQEATPTQLLTDFDAIVQQMRESNEIVNPYNVHHAGTDLGKWIAKTQKRQRTKIFRCVFYDYPGVFAALEKEGKL